MDWGPNAGLVQEVFDVFTPDHLVRGLVHGEIPIDADRFEFVENIREAHRLASTQDVWEEGYEDWGYLHDLLSFPFPEEPVIPKIRIFDSQCMTRGMKVSDGFEARLRELLPKAEGGYQDQSAWEGLLEWLSGDLPGIALARIQYGGKFEPHETMFSAYKQGGWPCGWKGEYPQGRMVVYHIGPKL